MSAEKDAPDMEAAISRIERSRQTHVEWRDYWLSVPGCSDCESCKETASIAGDLDRQVRVIAEYDNVLAVLQGIATREREVWDECVRAVAGVDPAAIHNPYATCPFPPGSDNGGDSDAAK